MSYGYKGKKLGINIDLFPLVENISGNDFKAQGIVIKFVNKDGSTYTDLEGIIGDVKAGETTRIDASTTADIINAFDFSIALEK